MILLGNLRSPFVRRVATTMHFYGIDYEHRPMGIMGDDAEKLRKLNPVGRVPALVLEDERVIVDSAVMLDHLDRKVGSGRSLTPLAGDERDTVLSMLSVATGAMEKAISGGYYEGRFRPEEKRHEPWVDRCNEQARGGIEWIEKEFTGSWMALDRMSQVDISTVIYWQFIGMAIPELQATISAPKIAALSERLSAMPEFQKTFPAS